MPDVVDPDVEEVRVALALNGGVSLAVWMGGCAVELDRARRTRSLPDRDKHANIYEAICDAFRRELVIDIMSGTSAGGINGALLAGAMVKGRSLEPDFLRKQWLELGDFSALLQPLSASNPTALMQGEYFADELDKTFKALLDGPAGPHEKLVPALDITTTHIAGTQLHFRDTWGGTLCAREHRARFQFREDHQFTALDLAAAARASASFPFAFEPFALPDRTAKLARLDGGVHVVDGGLLDNAPIRAALELIPTRPAKRQVRRLLCYVVGDPMPIEEAALGDEATPTTLGVLGVVFNVPREAPFADQFKALQAATRNPRIAISAEHDLLMADLRSLEAVARKLLPTYRRRRRLKALRDLLEEPADVQRVYDALEASGQELPWLQGGMIVEPAAWPWGIDAARRVHHQALDIIRSGLPVAGPADREKLLQLRSAIDDRLEALDPERKRRGLAKEAFENMARGMPPHEALAPLAARVDKDRPRIAGMLRDTAEGVLRALQLAPVRPRQTVDIGRTLFRRSLGRYLFGEDVTGKQLTDEMYRRFLRRVVAVEIVRRSFTDDDLVHNAQPLTFAQLTPDAPTPILSSLPLNQELFSTSSVEDKLCGAIIGHFGAFYRRSWRANDFLWGRLDAAARVVQMLVGVQRTEDIHREGNEPWKVIAKALVDGDKWWRALLSEAVGIGRWTSADELHTHLERVLEQDLTHGTGDMTRILCTCAVQFEILREELWRVAEEAASDHAQLGSTPGTLPFDGLDLKTAEGVYCAVKRMREGDCVLPIALGRDSRDELTSDLAARTMAHAGLVALNVARGAGGIVLSPLTTLRSALLPLAGAVALRWYYRFAVAVAFTAAAWFLAARIAGTNQFKVPDARELNSPELLFVVVSLLVVVGTMIIPVARMWFGRGWRRFAWGAIALLLLTVSGVVAGALAWIGPLDGAYLLVAPGVDVPWWVPFLALVLGAGSAAGVPPLISRVLDPATRPMWLGIYSLGTLFAAAALVYVWAWPILYDALEKEWWQLWTAILAFAAVPVSLLVVLVLPRLLAPPGRVEPRCTLSRSEALRTRARRW